MTYSEKEQMEGVYYNASTPWSRRGPTLRRKTVVVKIQLNQIAKRTPDSRIAINKYVSNIKAHMTKECV